MDYTKLVDTAILAGKIMLESNAESYRVEDTMIRILKISNLETTEALAITTGLIATLDDPSIVAITTSRRITTRDTNLNNIAKVNTICRNLTAGNSNLPDAYIALQNIKEEQFKPFTKDLAITLLTAFFALLLGGGLIDILASWINGVVLVLVRKVDNKIEMGYFIRNVISATLIAIITAFMHKYLFINVNSDVVITSSIMPLVPGTAITNAFRDTLRGDYMSGGAKALESVLIALSIAVGVAIGLILTGGGFF